MAELESARLFYDLLLGPPERCHPDHLLYCMDGWELRVYALTSQQSEALGLSPGQGEKSPGLGWSLRDPNWGQRLPALLEAGGRLRCRGPGDSYQLDDPQGFRWELSP